LWKPLDREIKLKENLIYEETEENVEGNRYKYA
jgi:hypothetical protein